MLQRGTMRLKCIVEPERLELRDELRGAIHFICHAHKSINGFVWLDFGGYAIKTSPDTNVYYLDASTDGPDSAFIYAESGKTVRFTADDVLVRNALDQLKRHYPLEFMARAQTKTKPLPRTLSGLRRLSILSAIHLVLWVVLVISNITLYSTPQEASFFCFVVMLSTEVLAIYLFHHLHEYSQQMSIVERD